MSGPPVRYVTTTDGISIAYTATGAGQPFVFMPWPFSNVSLFWDTHFGQPLAKSLAERFMLVQYDSRGQGMSTRGLSERHCIEDYVLDLEAVVERLQLDRFVLYGGPLFGHVAVRYAVLQPGHIQALILGETHPDVAWAGPGLEELARRDWNVFLHAMVSAFSLEGAPREFAYWQQSLDQNDCLHMFRAGSRSSVRKLLPSVTAPTLLLNTRRLTPDQPLSPLAAASKEMAALIPNTRLILFDGFASYWYSAGSEPPAAVQAIADFVDDTERAASRVSSWGPPPSTLTTREIEVIRKVAQGKTNREIATDLVISERTVINHLSHIFAKTGAENRAGAAAYAIRHGLG